jgi:hypothetical protein
VEAIPGAQVEVTDYDEVHTVIMQQIAVLRETRLQGEQIWRALSDMKGENKTVPLLSHAKVVF